MKHGYYLRVYYIVIFLGSTALAITLDILRPKSSQDGR
jgi:hypothetical protein